LTWSTPQLAFELSEEKQDLTEKPESKEVKKKKAEKIL
jgi:hypothetical protein